MHSNIGNKMKIAFRIGNQDGWSKTTKDQIVFDQKTPIVIKQVLDGSDYKFSMTMNGADQLNGPVTNPAPGPMDFKDVRVLTGEYNIYHVPADGRIENLRIWPGKIMIYFNYLRALFSLIQNRKK